MPKEFGFKPEQRKIKKGKEEEKSEMEIDKMIVSLEGNMDKATKEDKWEEFDVNNKNLTTLIKKELEKGVELSAEDKEKVFEATFARPLRKILELDPKLTDERMKELFKAADISDVFLKKSDDKKFSRIIFGTGGLCCRIIKGQVKKGGGVEEAFVELFENSNALNKKPEERSFSTIEVGTGNHDEYSKDKKELEEYFDGIFKKVTQKTELPEEISSFALRAYDNIRDVFNERSDTIVLNATLKYPGTTSSLLDEIL